MSFALAKALAAADRLKGWLAPFTERIEIAGSIRRGRPQVNDIDVVAIPRLETTKDLLGNPVTSRNLLTEEVVRRAGVDRWTIQRNGREVMIVQAGAWQVDLWIATPDRWGTLLLCRTGSAQFNIELIARAKAVGGKWNPHHGLYLGLRRVGDTEEAIFEHLGLRFIPPEAREAGAVRRFLNPKQP